MPSSRMVGTTVLDVARPQRVLGLQRRDRVHVVGGPQLVGVELRDAEMADLASVDQRRHGADGLGDRDVLGWAMHVVQVDDVDPET